MKKAFVILVLLIGLISSTNAISATIYKSYIDQDYGFYRVSIYSMGPTSDVPKTISYINKTLNISIGDSIIWTNDATPDWPLTIVSEQGLWNDTTLRWNYDKFNYTFNQSGIYKIHIKEYTRLQQTVIVNPVIIVPSYPIPTPTITNTKTPIITPIITSTMVIIPPRTEHNWTPILILPWISLIIGIGLIIYISYLIRKRNKDKNKQK